jgi:glutaredoxin 3
VLGSGAKLQRCKLRTKSDAEATKMATKRKIEVFSAGCALCHEVIDAVRLEAGSTSEVIVRDMMDARVLARAEKFGIRSVPAVVIDGKLASGCTVRGVDLQVLKNELGK